MIMLGSNIINTWIWYQRTIFK